MVANEPCRLISVNIWPTDRATELLMCDSYLGPRHTDRHCRPTWRSVCERCRHWLMSAVGRSSLSVVKVTTGRVTQPLTSLHETVWYSHWNETETAADFSSTYRLSFLHCRHLRQQIDVPVGPERDYVSPKASLTTHLSHLPITIVCFIVVRQTPAPNDLSIRLLRQRISAAWRHIHRK